MKVSGSGGTGRWSKSLRDRLVLVRLAVPVAAEAQHADVHLPAAADHRHVGGDRAVDERPALVDQRPLIADRQVAAQVKRARRDFHAFTLPLASVSTTISAETAEPAEGYCSANSASSAFNRRIPPQQRERKAR